VHVHAAELRAAVERGHHLAGIQQPVLVERVLDGAESLELARAELDAHLVDLLDADSVLAGDGAADLEAQLQYLAAEFLGARELAGLFRRRG
jgi:hypothetical protein